MKRMLMPAGLVMCVMSGVVTAADPIRVDQQGSVIGDDLLYSIGGGSAVNMGSAGDMDSVGVGLGWQNNLVCGNMDMSTTLQNQLNGATQGFQNIMSSVMQNATSAVASLPALIVQRANPALYNLLTNGILQARLDFDRSKATCRAMAEKMADMAGGQSSWGKVAEGQKMSQALASNSDAVAVVDQVEKAPGDKGVTWVGGKQAGGSGQPPVKVVSDVTKAGFNMLNKRSPTDTSAMPTSSCSNGMTCGMFESPADAGKFANRVLGEQEIKTCEGCSSESTPGVGLTPLIQEAYEEKLTALQDLLKSGNKVTSEQLRKASSDALPVTRNLIAALRDEPDRAVLTERLASEVALSDVLMKALMLKRMMISGAKESNVAANSLATDAVQKQTDTLQEEIINLKLELDMRRDLAGNSPMTIVERGQSRAENSRAVMPGATESNRLNLLQKTGKE